MVHVVSAAGIRTHNLLTLVRTVSSHARWTRTPIEAFVLTQYISSVAVVANLNSEKRIWTPDDIWGNGSANASQQITKSDGYCTITGGDNHVNILL